MRARIRTGALAAGTLALLVLPASASFAGPTAGPTPPAAVIASLAPGGDAFGQAVALDATAPGSGDVDKSKLAPDATRFGSPHQFRSALRSSSTDRTLTDSDFDPRWGTRWLSVEYVNGKAVNVLLVEPTGAFVQFGWDPAQIPTLAALPDGAQLFGAFSVQGGELYQLSNDATTVTALSPSAVALIGDGAVPASQYRDAKRAQIDARTAAQAGQPKDAVGAPPGGDAASEAATDAVTSRGSGRGTAGRYAFLAAIALGVTGIIARARGRRRHEVARPRTEAPALVPGVHSRDLEE